MTASGPEVALNLRECPVSGVSCAENDMPLVETINADVDKEDPKRGPLRFLLLLFCAIFMFGNYYFLDQTTAIQDSLVNENILSSEEFGILSSVYSYPNCVLPLLGGFLLDRIGVDAACIGFAFLVLAGQAIFTLGLYLRSLPLLFLSRVVFGLGGESQYVVACALLCGWFRDREMAFALGLIVTSSSLGTVATLNTQPALVARFGLPRASAVSTCIGLLSFLAAAAASTINKCARQAAEPISKRLQSDVHTTAVRINDILKFRGLFWLLVFSRITIHLAVVPFFSVTSQQYLESPRFGFNEEMADRITSLPNLVSVIICPVLGLLVDKLGIRPLLILLASIGFTLVQISFMLFPECTECYSISGLYVLMGVSLSLYAAAVAPCIALAVPTALTGTAFGVSSALQNVGSSLGPSIVSALRAETGDLQWSFRFIIAVCVLAILVAYSIFVLDRRTGRYLWKR